MSQREQNIQKFCAHLDKDIEDLGREVKEIKNQAQVGLHRMQACRQRMGLVWCVCGGGETGTDAACVFDVLLVQCMYIRMCTSCSAVSVIVRSVVHTYAISHCIVKTRVDCVVNTTSSTFPSGWPCP